MLALVLLSFHPSHPLLQPLIPKTWTTPIKESFLSEVLLNLLLSSFPSFPKKFLPNLLLFRPPVSAFVFSFLSKLFLLPFLLFNQLAKSSSKCTSAVLALPVELFFSLFWLLPMLYLQSTLSEVERFLHLYSAENISFPKFWKQSQTCQTREIMELTLRKDLIQSLIIG